MKTKRSKTDTKSLF